MASTIPIPSEAGDVATLGAALDASTHAERMAWMRTLNGKELAAVYAMAADGPALEVGHFHGEPGEVVIHHGQNSLAFFSAFQKRVVDNDGVLQGYNHQTMSWLTGPGHFTLSQDGGEVLFDYTREPVTPFDAFPPLKKNTSGISLLVYGHMVDRVRRVSRDCVIGTAFKKDKPFDAWFMLIREGVSSSAN